MSEKSILLTGYPPFGNHSLNPSGQAAVALDGQEILGYRIAGRVLPCDYLKMPPLLAEWLEQIQPAIVVGSGLAFGEPQIRVERVGLNQLDFRVPDNGGHSIQNEPALKAGPVAYFSTLPNIQIVKRLRQEGIPAGLSDNAGGHLCNHMLYTALHLAQTTFPSQATGFIHLPSIPELAALEAARDDSRSCVPSMSLDLIIQALRIVLEETVRGIN